MCITSSILRVLLSGFWVPEQQFPSPRDLFPGSWVSGSHVPESQFESHRCQGPVSQGLRAPGTRLPQSWVLGSQGPWSYGPGSQVPSIPCLSVQGLRVLGSQVSDLRVLGPGPQVLILGPDYAHLQWLLLNFISHHTKEILYVGEYKLNGKPTMK